MPPKKKLTPHQQYLLQTEAINKKFQELKKLRAQITSLKTLYMQHDVLMEELLPLFITVKPHQITIKRSIVVGDKKYRYNPHFYDVKKARIVAKVWKSTAFESGLVE